MVPGERELQGIRGDRGYDDTYLVVDKQLNIGELGGEGTFVLSHDPGDEIVEIVLTLTLAQNPTETMQRVLAGLNSIGDDAAALAAAQAALAVPAPVDPSDFEPAGAVATHTGDTSGAHAASAISNTPAGNIAATDVQAALNELDTEKASSSHTHAASAITNTPAGSIAAVTVQAAIDELDTEKQPVDGTLTALAGLTIAADSLSIGTGADAFTQTTFAANTFPAKSSAGALAAKAITDAALTVLDDTTPAAMVDTLGGASSTGSGGLVRATSPTLVTPALGTPASGVLTNCTDPRFLEVTQRIRKDIQRWIHATTGSAGWWTTATSGSGTSWFVTQPQYVSEMRSAKVYHALSLWTGTTTTGTNARAAYPNSVGSSWLSDGLRIIWHGLLQTPTLFESARVGAWGNGATPTSTGRPAYGVWLEKDATTLGNSNWWLCAANGGAVSTTDTGIAADATERVWMIEFEGTSSLKIWELGTSTTTPRGSTITTNLPSGNTPRSFTPFLQIQRVITTAGQSSLITINCDFGVLLDDCGLLYENPA